MEINDKKEVPPEAIKLVDAGSGRTGFVLVVSMGRHAEESGGSISGEIFHVGENEGLHELGEHLLLCAADVLSSAVARIEAEPVTGAELRFTRSAEYHEHDIAPEPEDDTGGEG